MHAKEEIILGRDLSSVATVEKKEGTLFSTEVVHVIMIRLLLWAIASSQPPSSSSFKKIQIFTVLCTSVALYRVDGVNTLEDDEL